MLLVAAIIFFAHGFGHSPTLEVMLLSSAAVIFVTFSLQLAVQCILHQNHPSFLEVILPAFMLIAFFVTFIFILFWVTPRSAVRLEK